MQFAPIAIFAFNRPDAIRITVESLLLNTESEQSDLFVFVDGPRVGRLEDVEKVKAVRDYVATIRGFKSVTYHFSDSNKGLGPSVISGVSEVIHKFGRVIVLEDDLQLTDNCLAFLNQGLDRYEDDRAVWSVCAYSNEVTAPKDYVGDSYFCARSSSWGWATWADRWNSVDWELSDWKSVQSNRRKFNLWGGSDCYRMLERWRDGHNKSWAIRFCYAQFVHDAVSLFPLNSKIINRGFDGHGTNCGKWSRFVSRTDLDGKKTFVWPASIAVDRSMYRQALRYHGILLRLYSRLMYMINR